MIVNNLNRTRLTFEPFEDDPPLIIDANRVEPEDPGQLILKTKIGFVSQKASGPVLSASALAAFEGAHPVRHRSRRCSKRAASYRARQLCIVNGS